MDVYVIVLRILHIVSGVFWVGSSLLFFFFLEPSISAIGPAAGPLMSELTQRRKMPRYITTAAITTIVAGILLYWEASGGFDLDWISSGPGITFTIGGVAGILALAIGASMTGPRVKRMGAIGAEVQRSGGPPSPEQAAELQRVQHEMRNVGRATTILLAIALVTMAIARYV